MIKELINRIRSVRISQEIERVEAGIYLTCPHWWAWWIPNGMPVWEFYDDIGNIHHCRATYGVSPAVITTTGSIVNRIWFGGPQTILVYGQELDSRSKDADRPTLYILYEHRASVASHLSFCEGTTTAALIIPQSAKWSAELSCSMHKGMLDSIEDIMRRACVDIIDATWLFLYNSNLANTGQGLPGEGNTLLLTLRWRSYK